jgi:hypothetical protein
MAVDDGRRSADGAGNAEQDGGDEVRRARHGRHAEEEREGAVRVHRVGERHQHRQADDAAEAGEGADRQADENAGDEDQQPRRLEEEG